MAIVAPMSKYRRTNFIIYIAVSLGVAVIFAYDGYLSKYKWSGRYSFYEEHVINNDGKPNSTMIINQKSPPFFLAAAIIFGVYYLMIRNDKLIADENELIFSGKKRIPYDSIEKINKTYFEKKGFFVITYKNESGRQVSKKISDKRYRNLTAVLDHLVAKIS